MNHRPITRRDFVRSIGGTAGAALFFLDSPAPGQTPAAKGPPGTALAFGTPVIASPWTQIIEYPTRLNDFCLFRDRQDAWHCIGIHKPEKD